MKTLPVRAVAACLAASFIVVSCGTRSGSDAPSSVEGQGGSSSAGNATGGSSRANGSTSASPDASTSGQPDGSTSPQQNDAGTDVGPIVAPQPVSPFIVVDQFGYRPSAEKVAVIRNPKVGFDSSVHFSPGATYALVDAHGSNAKVFQGAPTAWNGGATDTSSGDQAWSFDFSSVTAPGDYYVLDEGQNVRSDVFQVSSNVYATVLEQAIRMLYYQRDGTAKPAMYAGAGWADTMEHPQDAQCVTWDTNASPRDLHGGWFDAGDQNKYSNWGAVDAIGLLRAYRENPTAFTDDYGIPESGNGVPDVLDEAKWEIDWLLRMQGSDGGVLSIVGHQGASPPSADTSPCLYGPETTSASYSGAAVFALASVIFSPFNAAYASQLQTAAVNAWNWAQANPNVTFDNSGKVGAGEQELDTGYGLPMRQLEAALYLFEATGGSTYHQYFDANYVNAHMIAYGNYADMFEGEPQETLLDYTLAKGATSSIVSAIQSAYKGGMQGTNNIPAQQGNKDPYLAYIYTYVWGSNANRASQGTMYFDLVSYGIDTSTSDGAAQYAERYIHYFHGVNPLGLAYLSNMGNYGAANSVTCFFHSWFTHSSALWNQVGVSTYGPPPGYLPGGPNPSYALDSCCTSSTNSCSSQAGCASTPTPPAGQPSQKSYAQFNGDWPIDSWQVTEPDDGYQTAYIRLLSKFVN